MKVEAEGANAATSPGAPEPAGHCRKLGEARTGRPRVPEGAQPRCHLDFRLLTFTTVRQ